MTRKLLYFDHASTTRCCDAAAEAMRRYSCEEFGNPSSSHRLGQAAARGIDEARAFFAQAFGVTPAQVIFTGSGSEADNLAVYGVAMQALADRKPAPRVIASAIEHPAVRQTALSLASLGCGFEVELAPVTADAQIDRDQLKTILTPSTCLVSFHQVNNIVGSVLPVEELAGLVKARVPSAIFHTDAIQAFGKVDMAKGGSAVDLVSISAHKIEGPKGVGALIVLNRELLKKGLRPLIWGGGQEGGLRSGTQSSALIAGFHAAAQSTLSRQNAKTAQAHKLRAELHERLQARKLLDDSAQSVLRWNSPAEAVPHIVNLSAPSLPADLLASMLEERGCLISTGSACSSKKSEPDPVLTAMGLPPAVRNSALRISFGGENALEDVAKLVDAIDASVAELRRMFGATASSSPLPSS